MNVRRRILVSISHAASPRSVETALAGVWARDPAEITGLFIEDLEVLNLGRLRVSREVRYGDASARAPDTAEMERQVRACARRVQAVFESWARSMNVSASFRVARGTLASCLRDACADVDVLVVAGARDWMGQRLLLRSQLPQLLSGGPRTVIFVNHAARSSGSVAVLREDTDSGRAALQMASDIAQAEGLPLTVLLPPADDAERLRAESRAVIGDYPAVSYYRVGSENDPAEIATATQRAGARVLVLPRDGPETDALSPIDILERVDCSVILTG